VPVVLGWESPSGPLALPARWRTGDNAGSGRGASELATSGDALRLAGAASGGPACVTAERSRYRLKTKQGILLTGDGHARLAGGGPAARVAFDTRRTTWWSGEEQQTTAAHSG
jgi:hypothetical protein